MRVDDHWRNIGLRHPLWDYVRFYAGLRQNENYHKEWLAKLKEGVFEVRPAPPVKGKKTAKGKKPKPLPTPETQQAINLGADPEVMRFFLRYIEEREANYEAAASMLRSKDEAQAYCDKLKLVVTMTTTKLEGWQNSPNVAGRRTSPTSPSSCASRNPSASCRSRRGGESG